MLTFLIKVIGDPRVLCRLVSSEASDARGGIGFASGPEENCVGGEVTKRARLLLDCGDSVYGGGSSDAAAAAEFGGFYSAGADDVGFGGEAGGYLQPPPYVFPVNSGY